MMSGVESIPIGDASFRKLVPLPGATEASAHPDDPSTGGPDPESLTSPGSGVSQLAWMAEESLRIGVGFASAVATALARALESVTPMPKADDELVDAEPVSIGPSPIAVAAGAAAGLTFELATAAIRAGESAADVAWPLLSWVAFPSVLRRPVTAVEDKAVDLNDRWSSARRPSEEAAAAFARELIPEVANALLDQIDLTQLVVDRVDIDRIVDGVDLGQIIARMPIDEIIARIDLNAVVGRVDINAIVERIDLNEIADRIDLDALVARIDVVGIAQEVIVEIDLPQIIRASSGTMATETVEAIRFQTMDADRLLERVVDRLLLRKRERRTDASGVVPPEHPDPAEVGQ
jgi:hypothetical protein